MATCCAFARGFRYKSFRDEKHGECKVIVGEPINKKKRNQNVYKIKLNESAHQGSLADLKRLKQMRYKK